MFKVIATALAGNGGVVVDSIPLSSGEAVYLDILTNDIEQAWEKGYVTIIPYHREVKVKFLYADDDFSVEPYPDPSKWLKLPEYGQANFFAGSYYTASGLLRVDQNHTDNWLESTWSISGDFEIQFGIFPNDTNSGFIGLNPDSPHYRASNQFRLWIGYETVGLFDRLDVKHELKGPATKLKKITRVGDVVSIYGRNDLTEPWGSAIISARMHELDMFFRVQLGYRGFNLDWVGILSGTVLLAIWSEAPRRKPNEVEPELLDPKDAFIINNTTFTKLTDCPDDYVNQDGNIPTVDEFNRQLIWLPRTYLTVATKADRDRISTFKQIQGLKVFITDIQMTYVLLTPSNTLDDSCWIVDSGMYDIVGSIPSYVPGNTTVNIFLAGRPMVIPINFLGSRALAKVAPTSTRFDITILKDGLVLGVMRFTKDNIQGELIALTQAPMLLSPGEMLTFHTQNTEDETLQGVGWYILGSLL